MRNNQIRKFVSSILSAAMLTSATAVYMPLTATAEADIINIDFDDGIAMPWISFENSPNRQIYAVDDGVFGNTIISALEDGERTDLGFKTQEIELFSGHEYLFKADITAKKGDFVLSAVVVDGESNIIWDSLDVNDGQPYVVKDGETLEFEQTFTIDETSSHCRLEILYGKHEGYDVSEFCSVICLDNILLRDLDENAVVPEPNEYGIVRPQSNVRINKLGYLPNNTKRASYCTDNSKPCTFELRDSNGNTVYEGKAVKVVLDYSSVNPVNDSIVVGRKSYTRFKDGGKYVQILDFSDFTDTGEYTIFVHDDVGVSEIAKGRYETTADGDKLLWTNWVTKETFVMNESAVFRIDSNIYKESLLEDSLNYFYLNRSGTDIKSEHVVSSDNPLHTRKAVHSADTAYVQNKWIKFYEDGAEPEKTVYSQVGSVNRDYSIDVTGGWYNSDSYSKNVINGSSAVWTLQNTYEFAKQFGYADTFAEGELHFNSDNKNGVPDILDEARYELDWMMKMMVSEDDPYWGKECAGMVYHGVKDTKWTGFPTNPLNYEEKYSTERVVLPPTYAATFDFAACAAQASRLWREFDKEYADKCIELAKKAFNAANKDKKEWDVYSLYNNEHAAPEFSIGGEIYSDFLVRDEHYWAACELYSATGNSEYLDELEQFPDIQPYHSAYGIARYCLSNPDSTPGAYFGAVSPKYTLTNGTLSLFLNPQVLTTEQYTTIAGNILDFSQNLRYLMHDEKNGMGLANQDNEWTSPSSIDIDGFPDITSGYGEDSNATVIFNAMISQYAYAVTGDNLYLNTTAEAMDYIFGRNGNDFSYVTGYGEHSAENVNHLFWGGKYDENLPDAPKGVLVSGPYCAAYDPIIGLLGINLNTTASQKIYADSYDSFTTNHAALQLNAPLAAITAYLSAASSNEVKTYDDTIPPTKDTLPQLEITVCGDANCDGNVNMADAVLVMQSLANPNKYGINGTDDTHITEQGRMNADVNGEGMTNSDALDIQKYILHLIESLPVE
ncbi:MAG: glycoside hydrolase family 9 protein [Ruminococcus sp.]|nr:glycoside hydrolase family 9 protein [Ruminococcus sp.]